MCEQRVPIQPTYATELTPLYEGPRFRHSGDIGLIPDISRPKPLTTARPAVYLLVGNLGESIHG